jgi:hypothetical protein
MAKIAGCSHDIVRLTTKTSLLHSQRHRTGVGKRAEIEEPKQLGPGEAFVVHRYLPGQLVRSNTLAILARTLIVCIDPCLEFLLLLPGALHRLTDFLVDLQMSSALS